MKVIAVSVAGPESEAVESAAIHALKNVWEMLTKDDFDAERLYDLNQQKAFKNAETVITKIRRHYLIPAE